MIASACLLKRSTVQRVLVGAERQLSRGTAEYAAAVRFRASACRGNVLECIIAVRPWAMGAQPMARKALESAERDEGSIVRSHVWVMLFVVAPWRRFMCDVG